MPPSAKIIIYPKNSFFTFLVTTELILPELEKSLMLASLIYTPLKLYNLLFRLQEANFF